MTGDSENNRSEPQGDVREGVAEGSGEQRPNRRNTNWQLGQTRVISVRVNAKSNQHRKPRLVELGGMCRKFGDLTQGGLWHESVGEVSRGHSSDKFWRKSDRAKGRRIDETAKPGVTAEDSRSRLELEGAATAATSQKGAR